MARSPLERHQWINPDVHCLRGVTVREYDMADAGMSTVRKLGLFPRELARLEATPKGERLVELGKLVGGDPAASAAIMADLVEARTAFGAANGLDDGDILAVRRDAIFVAGKRCTELAVSGHVFKEKARYSSYYRVGKVELLWSAWDRRLDVKGLGKETRAFQAEHMLSKAASLISVSEKCSARQTMESARHLRHEYLGLRLPAGCYREMNSHNLFRTRLTLVGMPITMLEAGPDDVPSLDVGYNYAEFLAPLFGLMV
jgi:hypothetical protein